MTGRCLARTFIDGVRVEQSSSASIDDLLSPELIAAVEMYPRGFQAPPQYTDALDPRCGVVLFWTKEPRQGESSGWSVTKITVGLGVLVGILMLGLVGT